VIFRVLRGEGGKLKALPDKGICISLKPISVQHYQNVIKWDSVDLRGFQEGKFMIKPGMGICIFLKPILPPTFSILYLFIAKRILGGF
jgi:hypothetical protein